MRDAVIRRINQEQEMVITTDGCTGVGSLVKDKIKASLDIVAYNTARVALMELLSLKAKPVGYSFNFIADNASYEDAVLGFKRAFVDFGFPDTPYISSSEKNFDVFQSSITISITGLRPIIKKPQYTNSAYIVVGAPLVGKEVLLTPEKMISPKEFLILNEMNCVYGIIPAGSGGIRNELKQFGIRSASANIDLDKSAGPATCVLAVINGEGIETLREIFGDKISEIRVNTYE